MGTKLIPLIMHRWFENGAAWAYYPSVIRQIHNYADCLRAELADRSVGEFEHSCGRVTLIGIRQADDDCLDERAANRRPFLLISAVMKGRQSESSKRKIYDQLRRFDIPLQEGTCDTFYLTVEKKRRFQVISRAKGRLDSILEHIRQPSDLAAVTTWQRRLRQALDSDDSRQLERLCASDFQLLSATQPFRSERPEDLGLIRDTCLNSTNYDPTLKVTSHYEIVTATRFANQKAQQHFTFIFSRHWLFRRKLSLVTSIIHDETEHRDPPAREKREFGIRPRSIDRDEGYRDLGPGQSRYPH